MGTAYLGTSVRLQVLTSRGTRSRARCARGRVLRFRMTHGALSARRNGLCTDSTEAWRPCIQRQASNVELHDLPVLGTVRVVVAVGHGGAPQVARGAY